MHSSQVDIQVEQQLYPAHRSRLSAPSVVDVVVHGVSNSHGVEGVEGEIRYRFTSFAADYCCCSDTRSTVLR